MWPAALLVVTLAVGAAILPGCVPGFCTEPPANSSTSATQDEASASGDSMAGDPAAQLFTQKCSGCHTVGRGTLVGPDLQEVASWKTVDLESNVKRMEKFVGPLKNQDIAHLVKFLKDLKVKDRLKAEEERAIAAETKAEPSSAQVGYRLFSGVEQFKNGGSSCIACHQTQGRGGTMGKDLTDAFSKLGESALVSTCENPSYPVMKAVYRDHQLTKQEALHLTKYLGSLKEAEKGEPDPPVTAVGFIGAAVFLCGIMFFYRNRNTGIRARLNGR